MISEMYSPKIITFILIEEKAKCRSWVDATPTHIWKNQIHTYIHVLYSKKKGSIDLGLTHNRHTFGRTNSHTYYNICACFQPLRWTKVVLYSNVFDVENDVYKPIFYQ